eukprot:5427239-Amphidinium_carterae.2
MVQRGRAIYKNTFLLTARLHIGSPSLSLSRTSIAQQVTLSKKLQGRKPLHHNSVQVWFCFSYLPQIGFPPAERSVRMAHALSQSLLQQCSTVLRAKCMREELVATREASILSLRYGNVRQVAVMVAFVIYQVGLVLQPLVRCAKE